MAKSINEIDIPLSKEIAKQGLKKIRAEEFLKKNWRFVAICLTILLCVAIVCGTVWGITCHFATLETIKENARYAISTFEKSMQEAIDALKEIAYATEVVTETITVEETAETGDGGIANVGDSNAISMGGG